MTIPELKRNSISGLTRTVTSQGYARPNRGIAQWAIFAVVVLAALAVGGAMLTAKLFTPSQTCENVIFAGGLGQPSSQYTFCFDVKTTFDNLVEYRGTNNPLKFGLKSTGPTMKMSSGGNGRNALLQVFTKPSGDLPQGTVTLWGTIGFISDTVPTVVMNGSSTGQNFEELRLDTATGLVKNDLPDSYNLSSAPAGTVRNSTYTLSWLGRAQLAAMAAGAITDTTKLDMVFDLNAKLFTGTLPLPLKIAGEQQNVGLIVTPTLIFQPTGFKQGKISDFTLKLGAFDIDVKNVNYVTGTFTAGQADVLKSKNPQFAVLGTEPSNSNLLFGITGLKYTSADNKFSIAGGDVGVRNINLGGRVQLTNNRLGVLYDPAGKTYATIKSTLSFPNHLQTSTQVTSTLLFGRKLFTQTGQFERYFEGGVADFTGKIGPLNLNLKQARIVGDQVDDFYGLRADALTASWNSVLGDGQSGAGMTGFKLGVKGDGKVQFTLNGGVVQFASVQNGLFKGTGVTGAVSVISETVTFTATTNISLKTAGGSKNNSGVVFNPVLSLILRAGPTVQDNCPGGNSNTCLRKVDGRVDDFSVGIAAFKFRLAGVRPLGDGGFAVQTATLTVPSILAAVTNGNNFATLSKMSAQQREAAEWAEAVGANATPRAPNASLPPGPSVTVVGFKYNADGSFNVAGGVIEMPPLKLGDYKLGGAKLGFIREVVSDTLFYTAIGGVTVGIPDMDTPSFALSAQVSIKTKKDFGAPGIGDFEKLDVQMNLTFPNPGVPIVPPILTLDEIGAGASWTEQVQVFTANVGIGTVFQIGPVDLIRINGSLTIRPKPFLLSGRFNPKLLNFIDLSNTTFEIGNGAGFMSCPPGQSALLGTPPNQTPNPNCAAGKGFHLHSRIQKLILFGDIDLRVGMVNSAPKIQGTANFTVGIAKATFGPLPRDPINLTSVQFQLGKFRVPYKGSETLGAMGTLNVTNNFRPSVFLDFAEDCCFATLQGGGKMFNFGTNVDGYVFLNTAMVQQQLARNAEGYRMARLPGSGAGLGPEAAERVQLTIPVVFTTTGGAMVAFTYSSTVSPAPSISIVRPDNVTVTPANATANGFEYKSSPDAVNTDLIFYFVAQPGTYQLVIDNAPAEYDINSMVLNNPPTLSNVAVSFSRGLPVIGWTAADGDSPDAKVAVFYARVYSGTTEPDLGSMIVITENVALGNGSLLFNREHIQTGQYKLVVQVYDGKNPPVSVIEPTLFNIVNTAPPAVPTGLAASSLPNQLLLRWDLNTEADIAGYEIGFALVPDSNQMLYTRDVGLRETYNPTPTTNLQNALLAPASVLGVDSENAVEAIRADQRDARLWVPSDGDTIYYSVRAYDLDGNFSDWAPMTAGTAWPISPKSYTPAPNGSGQSIIEVGFAATLNPATINTSSIVVVDATTGVAVPGTTTAVLDSEDNVVGLRFLPQNRVVEARYRASLAGGSGGVAATDGRTMPDNFVWSFNFSAAAPPTVYLPLVRK
jgi:hypothetical protein